MMMQSSVKTYTKEEVRELIYKCCLGVDFYVESPEKELQNYSERLLNINKS